MSVARRTSWYLLSSLGAPLISFATLPLFTTKLGPEEFGAFALGTALTGVVSATSSSFSMISLPAELGRLSPADRRPFMTAMMALTLLTALVCSAVVFVLYLLAVQKLGLQWLGYKAALLLLTGGLFHSIWGACVEMHTVEGRARNYAITSLVQTITSGVAIAMALFVFDDTMDALFWGYLCAGAVGAASAAAAFRHLLSFHNMRHWFARARRGSHAAMIAALSENGKMVLERSYISSLLGLTPLGFLAHAQYYKNAAMVAINALSRGVLPTALEEAHAQPPMFPVTVPLWKLVQGFALAATLGFALLGRETIGLLTHEKFVTSAPYATVLMAGLLLQTAAKPHLSLLLARGRGHVQAHINTMSLGIAMGWLLLSVPSLGIWGVITSFLLQIILYRIGIILAANRIYRLPFTDGWVIVGIVLIGACEALTLYANLSTLLRLLLLLVFFAAIMWQLKPSLLMMRSLHPPS